MRISPESIARYDLPQIVDPRRQQNHATIVLIGHEDELPFVDGQVPRNVQLTWVRAARRSTERLHDASVAVESTEASWIVSHSVSKGLNRIIVTARRYA